jgi:drug/metabolite transporter (DMT)-like permease
LYWIINMKDERDALVKTFTNMLTGSILITIYILFTGNYEPPSAKALLGASYIGVFEMGITFVFWLKALKLSVNTAKVSNLVFLSPFLALFWVRIFVGEKIMLSTVVGLLLIITGILIQQLDKVSLKKRKPNKL